MITKQQVMTYRRFYHKTCRNADGTAARCRANGVCKTWKTRPDDFRLPVKWGLKNCFYLTPTNANGWLTFDLPTVARQCGLSEDTPVEILTDRAKELGLIGGDE